MVKFEQLRYVILTKRKLVIFPVEKLEQLRYNQYVCNNSNLE